MSRRSYSVLELRALFGDEDAIAELFTRPAVPERRPAVPERPSADLARRQAAGREAYERAWAERYGPEARARAQIFCSALKYLYPEEASGGR